MLWVYSTLLMQQRVPNDYLGRISALEGAAYTISESISSVFGGAPGAAMFGGAPARHTTEAGMVGGLGQYGCQLGHGGDTPHPSCPSTYIAGAAFDVLHLSLHHLLLILTCMAGVMAAGWSLYAWIANRGSGRPGSRGGYLPVRQSDDG